jgi:hypothetical protein
MTKFMNTKERCLQCGIKLEKREVIKTNEGYKVCSNWCKDNWNLDTK